MAGKAGRRVRRLTLSSLYFAAPLEIPTAPGGTVDEGGILVLPVGDEQQFLNACVAGGGEFIIDNVECRSLRPVSHGSSWPSLPCKQPLLRLMKPKRIPEFSRLPRWLSVS